MTNVAVIGLGYGDEGKGVVTEYLCSQNPDSTIVVRFSGGHQCGHKVTKGTTEHIFSNFGSGTLSGCPTCWSRYCTFDPVGLWNEYKILKAKGITPKIYVHRFCPVVTPYDVFVGRNGVEIEHGTTGTGFFRTLKRTEEGPALYATEMLSSVNFEIAKKLYDIQKYYGIKRINFDIFWEAVRGIRTENFTTVRDEHFYPHQTKIFEGSQGLMLDPNIGYMPHCTPSDISPHNIFKIGYSLDEIYLVTRAYQTRHGNGPLTYEGLDFPKLINTEKETNVYDKYQGEFRKSILDLGHLMHAKERGIDEVVPKDTKINLVVTCVDQMSEYHVYDDNILKRYVFDNVNRFVKFLGERLNINGDLYINDSPCSDTVRRIKC